MFLRLFRRWKTIEVLRYAEICYNSGFKNVHYFINTFKKLVGFTPKMFRTANSL
ncbi:AraC family transcriptional regulator [Niabella terrae]